MPDDLLTELLGVDWAGPADQEIVNRQVFAPTKIHLLVQHSHCTLCKTVRSEVYPMLTDGRIARGFDPYSHLAINLPVDVVTNWVEENYCAICIISFLEKTGCKVVQFEQVEEEEPEDAEGKTEI